ncbi:hypothetical protein DL96DRAFT_1605022 [Flagelloscypha sp. PMI_526]|nr:hypothetical protein DL96DRAFT_1605022 [Flagelloscypha sp. PMI_526]
MLLFICLTRFLLSERQTKKSTARTMAFQTQKKVLYDSARQTSHSLVQAGLSRLDEIKESLHELKKQERSLESHLHEFLPTIKAQDEHYTTLIAQYSSMHDHLFPSRVKITDEASGMIRNCPALREEALEHALICAREEVDAARIRRKNAADASDLLKKYKLLLQ